MFHCVKMILLNYMYKHELLLLLCSDPINIFVLKNKKDKSDHISNANVFLCLYL